MARRNYSEMRSGIPTTSQKEPEQKRNPTIDMNNAIQRRAYEIYLQRDGMHGMDQSDWFQAEQELKRNYNIGG